jgi:fibronectin-binding autotransporter adhesin
VNTISGELEAGLALHLGSYGMRPYAMVDMQSVKRDAIKETGAGAANLNVAAATDMLGEFGVGIELSRPWLTAGARWAQLQTGIALVVPFGDTQREQSVNFTGTAPSYTVKATAVDTPSLQFTLGGEWYFTPSLALWGGYEGRVSSTSQEHNGVISLQYRW